MKGMACFVTAFAAISVLGLGPLGCKNKGGFSVYSTGGMSSATTASGGLISAGGAASEAGPPMSTGGAAGGSTGPVVATTGGSAGTAGAAPSAGGAAGPAGGSAVAGRTVTGGNAPSGGATAKTAGATGTAVPSTGGMMAGGAGGATNGGGGAPANGGASAVAGARGTGGATGNGGVSGACNGCQAHESCWTDASGSRCIESAVSVPGAFAIDATEVTRGQYSAWLATHPPTTGQAEICAWNTTFTPDATCMAKASVCQGDACATHPQPCVDWCDAAAYCKAIGRSLCTAENWTNACTSNGTYAACYATSFVRKTCNDYTLVGSTTVPVATMTGCQPPATSAFAGVFDLIGNLAEWVDKCTGSAGMSDTCRPYGLSFGNGAAAPVCSQYTYADRSATAEDTGFRCCAP